jgi:hypothetical protein
VIKESVGKTKDVSRVAPLSLYMDEEYDAEGDS